jgi:DNA-directed RNA polymerase subunit RPC12/RpoP
MNPEIRELIKLAIAGGEITEKKREVIMHKAQTLGEDIDEVEMILDGELALMKKEQKSDSNIQLKSNKEGELIKCPSCGSIVPSFTTKCADCGHEFRRIEATHSVKQLFAELTNVENEERSRPRNKGGYWQGEQLSLILLEQAIANRKATIISSFPVSNSKEDILEFLSMAVSEVTQKPSWLARTQQQPSAIGWLAWNSKCQQVILKARFSMKDDKKTLEKIETYAKQLKIK